MSADSGSKPQTEWTLVVADAGWYTTANLFREVPAERATTLLLRCSDYRVAWSQGKRWLGGNKPPIQQTGHLWDQDLVLPTGFMKSFPRIGMRPIARAVRRWRKSVGALGQPLALVATYPFYIHLARQLRPDRLIYFNIDDYRLYWPRAVELVTRVESEIIELADLTVCASEFRTQELRSVHPRYQAKIRHLPHGAPTASIPDAPQDLPAAGPADLQGVPRPWVGYVGTLEDRVDWKLLDQTAEQNPRASLIFIGRPGEDGSTSWQEDRRRCLSRANVHAIGWRNQGAIESYNRAFDLALIPYRTDHPFNIACCPTKIMDYMAAGRPVVATDLPECRLYDHVFDVVAPDDFAAAVARRLASGPDDGRARARWDLARRESCRAVITRLLDWID